MSSLSRFCRLLPRGESVSSRNLFVNQPLREIPCTSVSSASTVTLPWLSSSRYFDYDCKFANKLYSLLTSYIAYNICNIVNRSRGSVATSTCV